MIKVIVVEPNKDPYLKEIDTELESLQKEVAGYIEVVDINNTISIVCNEEGKLIPLPHNRMLCGHSLEGTFLLSGFDYDSGELVSLTDDEIENILKDLYWLDTVAIYLGGCE